MKYAELLCDWLEELGYTHCFFVAGGGVMHLLDGVRNRFECIPVIHEVTAGICAEHFNECASRDRKAFALVTTGPGLTNIVTAIAGCFVEHRELLVIAGQVKSSDLLTVPERQRGVQEVPGGAICAPISVRSECLQAPISRSRFQALARLAEGPHPGPVLIEVCLDVQGMSVNPEVLCDNNGEDFATIIPPRHDDVEVIRKQLTDARRPLILLGGLVSREAAWTALPVFESLGLPVATTTSAIDRVPTDSAIFVGRPGTWGGQRAANLLVAQADVIITIGAQLDLQQTGFNYREYAPQAKLIQIFPSQAELDRTGPPSHAKVVASPDVTLAALLPKIQWTDLDGWGEYVREVRALIPSLEPANISGPGYTNSFSFLQSLSQATQPSDVLALCSSGGAFTGSLQAYKIAPGQLATTSAAHASMGYGLATAIGASFADRSRRIVLTEGEGGFSQNLQELAVIKRFSLPIKIFLLENQGYASIRATQKKFFNGAYLGCDEETGLGFPDWGKLFAAYDIPYRLLGDTEAKEGPLRDILNQNDGPEAWSVRVDPNQPNWPAVSSVLSADGSITSAPLYEMLPKLSEDILSQVGRYLPQRELDHD